MLDSAEEFLYVIEQKPRKDCVRCMMNLIILGILHKQPTHAYKLRKIVAEKFEVLLYPGNFYPKLRNFETNGLIKGNWETGGHRKRKVYNLTSSGVALYRTLVDGCYLKVYNKIVKDLESPIRENPT
jgi:DNA-binding PadR family transcriptional regulator